MRFDDTPVRPEVAFPHYNTAIAEFAAIPTVLGTTVRLSGHIPDGAANFTFGASRAFNALHVTILEQLTGASAKHVLGAGEDTPTFLLNQPLHATTRSASSGSTFARYLGLGFEHILPHGLDHILFVLGLFLLSPKLAPLLWQVTAFTVAHSITLALAAFNVISLPPSVVEPLIALSITYVAVENILTPNLKRWRPLVVFAFGLLHGLGFAGVLADIGLPRGEYLLSLAAFNLGVEAGQAAVVALAFLAVGAFRRHTWYRRAVIVPASVMIAVVGAWWTVERLL
ncbi:MAG: membrane protein [Planctomycetota bacterium]|nr:MAG: membrane protein [Planctomycetota bacterium]